MKACIFLGALAVAGFGLGDNTSYAQTTAGAVSIREDQTAYTLDNGIVAARVDKGSGDLVSLRYKGAEMLATILGPDGLPDIKADPPGQNGRGFGPFTDHQYGFWSHDAMGPRDTQAAVARITIDPSANGGERGEVSIKGISNGRKMGTGPGSNAQGNVVVDIEIRYAMGRSDSGVYTYSIWEHRPEYPETGSTEARFCMKLNDTFDWMLVDQNPHRNKLYPKTLREDKYDYTTDQFDHRAFGWASTTTQTGCFIVNPSMEYMSGGPTKIEFLCHRDTNQVAAPCVLNYWRSSHYGGSSLNFGAGEQWSKVVGPFFLYVNSGGDPQTLWHDALAQADRESQKWPYDWVNGVDYPHSDARGTVSGRLVLSDPLMPDVKMAHILVGLTHSAYMAPSGGGPGGPRTVDWQTDAKHYEFWVRGEPDGRFVIPSVRPGTYTLHAIADGVLGELAKTDITVAAGQTVDLSDLIWAPVRRGRQIWEIGIPNRTATEFFKGDDFFHDGMPVLYAQLFPNDINFVIGQSDYGKDWYYMQVPHADPVSVAAAEAATAAAAAARAGGAPPPQPPVAAGAASGPAGARGRRGPFGPPPITGFAAPRSITFEMPTGPKGKATLRVAVCGTGARSLAVTINGQPAGTIALAGPDATFGMGNGIQGIWYEREFPFDASMLKAGTNVLTLTIPAGPVNNGVIYDYLRLELDGGASATAAPGS
jgi:rhamnogalacturonan endolyase